MSGLELTPEQVAALEHRTEGWIAALQLAALSLRGRTDVGGFIARFDGDDRYVVDYLMDEVLGHQPEPVRGFLARTAVLDRLTGPLCDAVTGGDDGREMLTALDRANLFVVPLDDQREWYRFHHLFADVLRARLLAERPDLVPLLHERASRWYERHDLADESVRHALAAGDMDRVVHLMEMEVASVRRDRREATFMGWLKAVPDEFVRRSPVLSVFSAYTHMASGNLDAVEPPLLDAERELARVPTGSAPPWADTDELHTLPATIAVYRASVAQARGDIPATRAQARRALDLARPSDHLARGSAAGFLGLAAWAEGDVTSALETFTQAVASLNAAGAFVDELSSTVVLADLALTAGRPLTALRLYQRALERAEAHGEAFARATVDLHVGVSEVEGLAGETESARRHLSTAAALADPLSMAESGYRWFVAMARVVEAEGEPDEAIALLDQAEELYRPGFFPDVRPIGAMKARVWIRRGRLSEATGWATGRGVSVTDDARYLNEFDHLTLVRLLIAEHRERPSQGRLDPVAGLLDRLETAAVPAGRAGSVLEIRMLRSLASDASGSRSIAVDGVVDALGEVPEPEGYARLFVDEGRWMTALLRDVTSHDAAAEQARRILALALTPGARTSATATLSDRELQVLRLLDSELTGPEIARRLFVSPNTLRTHTKHIFTKLDVTSRRAAVRQARERGLM
jgi:LuxR family maltose regulon positive regulatory protein